MYIKFADQATEGYYAASVLEIVNERTRAGQLVATFRHKDKDKVAKWAEAFAAGKLDIPDAPTAPAPLPIEEAPPEPGPPASVAAKALAKANGVDLGQINYNGPKITKPDVEAYIIEITAAMPFDPPEESPSPE